MNLLLENYIFQIIENQNRLSSFLGDDFNWSYSLDRGTLIFTRKNGESICECPMQILGTESYEVNSWLWAWANIESGIPENLLRGVIRVREQAQLERNEIFLENNEIELTDNAFGTRLSIICVGFLGNFAYFKCTYEGGCMHVSIVNTPIQDKKPRTVSMVISAINIGISNFAFNHQKALLKYLGNNFDIKNGKYIWELFDGNIEIEIDKLARIKKIESVVKKID